MTKRNVIDIKRKRSRATHRESGFQQGAHIVFTDRKNWNFSTMASKPKMTLYQSPLSRSFKGLWLIHELGIHDNVDLVKIKPLNKDTEEYKKYVKSVHPHGTVPALVVEGEGVILESTAICLYLADLYGKLAPAPDKRREYYDWIMYSSNTMEPVLDFLFFQWVMPKGDPDVEGIKKMEAKFEIGMKRLAQTLEGKDFVLGDSLTAADCVVGVAAYFANMDIYNKGSLVKDFPSVQAYVKRLMERPAFKAAIEAQGEFED